MKGKNNDFMKQKSGRKKQTILVQNPSRKKKRKKKFGRKSLGEKPKKKNG